MRDVGKRQLRIVLIVVGLLAGGALIGVTSGCSNDDSGEAAEAAKVKEAFEEYAGAVKDGDLEYWISLWADDSRRLAPNAPASVGVEQIRAAVEPLFELFDTEAFDINTEEVQVLGERAYSYGTYSFSMTPKAGGDAIEDSGKFLTIFEKQADGAWKIAVDSFSSNMPAS